MLYNVDESDMHHTKRTTLSFATKGLSRSITETKYAALAHKTLFVAATAAVMT